jgi:uncharacterized membrane protein
LATAAPAPELLVSTGDETLILPVRQPRLASVDLLRGLVMVMMALDHTRRFFTGLSFAPEDLAHTSAPLFFTRFVTHPCAPVFFLLAGTAAFLSVSHGKSVAQLSRFLWTRGLWLLFLDVSLIGYAWTFTFPFVHGGVIWALAWSMIAMTLIVHLPVRWIAALGIGIVVTHNLLDRVVPADLGNLSWLWFILHRPGEFWIQPGRVSLLVTFPIIPWVGVMAIGYALGPLLLRQDRRKLLFALGAIVTLAFFVLRAFNLYGNGNAAFQPVLADSAGPWKVQPTLTLTIVSFFNTLKFPPSLQLLLMTLGPSLILLAWFDRITLDKISPDKGLAKVLLVFGRVPFFFYVIHLYLIHTAAVWIALASHQPTAWLLYGGFLLRPVPNGYGHGLPFIYAIWAILLVLLYFPCAWFMNFKQQHRDWHWLSYL